MPTNAPTQPGPFELLNNADGLVGRVEIKPDGAMVTLFVAPFGREDLRAIGHRLLDIANYDTGLRE